MERQDNMDYDTEGGFFTRGGARVGVEDARARWDGRLTPDWTERAHERMCAVASAEVNCIGDGTDGAGCGRVSGVSGTVCETCGGMLLSDEAKAEAAALAQRMGMDQREECAGVDVKFGNLEGKYFSQWRVNLLTELLHYVTDGFGLADGAEVSDAEIWYDADHDYHRLSFTSNGHRAEVRFYKVFSCEIDGEDGWVGAPRGKVIAYAKHLREKVSA